MKINNRKTQKSVYTRIAGISYILVIILALIPSNLVGVGDIFSKSDATKQLLANEGLLRLGIAIELTMFIFVMVLSWALFVILRQVNKNLALLALLFRFGEAILGCFVILFYLIALQFLDNVEYLRVFEIEQLLAMARFSFGLSNIGYNILLIIMGIGGTIFCYLFFVSRLIPRAISIWGMLTYSIMVLFGFVRIGFVNPPPEIVYVMIPGALFEIVIGVWFIAKGVSVEYERTNHVEAS